jgi:hypothetical protein
MATDAARDLNLAARFGRLDIAATQAAEKERPAFLKRRAGWGTTIRVLDFELAGLEMEDAANATVFVDISWIRPDESNVQTTRISQGWRDERVGGWQLVAEKRIDGDKGLFGEKVERQGPRPDAHFPVTVIR